jgi:hypothetical protein
MMLSCSTFMLAAVLASTGVLSGLPEYKPDANADRGSIPAAYLWDLTVLFPDDDAWSQTLEKTRVSLEGLSSLHDTLGEPESLAAYMEIYFSIELTANRLSLYASLQKDGDTTDDPPPAGVETDQPGHGRGRGAPASGARLRRRRARGGL